MKKPIKAAKKSVATQSEKLTIGEAAQRLKISRQGVHRAIRTGQLEAERGKAVVLRPVTVSGWLISPKAIAAYEVSLRHQASGKKTTDRLTLAVKRK